MATVEMLSLIPRRSRHLAHQYSDTLECFFIPPTTNDYVFYAAGADINDVYLSTDTDPANMVNIAQLQWLDQSARLDGTAMRRAQRTNGLRSDWYTGNVWPGAGDPATGSAFIHLDGGQKYYLFAFHHRFSWSGGDDFAVTYTYAGAILRPQSGEAPVLTGSVVGTYLDPTGASVTFIQQPADVTILQGRKATFTAVVTGQSLYGTNVAYQWQTAPSWQHDLHEHPRRDESVLHDARLGGGGQREAVQVARHACPASRNPAASPRSR